MTVCNMSIEAGARAGMIAPDDTTFSYLEGRPHAPRGALWEEALEDWRSLPTEPGAAFDAEVRIDAAELLPYVSWGTNPGQTAPVTDRVPDPEDFDDPLERDSTMRALAYMDLRPGTPISEITIDRVFLGSCTNARIEDLRAAAALVRGRRVHPDVSAMVVPGSGLVKRQAETEGLDVIFRDSGFEWRDAGCSMCLGMNPDILAAGRTLRIHLQSQFRGTPGPGRTHPPGLARHGRGRRRLGQVRGHPGVGERLMRAVSVIRGTMLPLPRANVDTDQIMPKQFLKRVERTGYGKIPVLGLETNGLKGNPIPAFRSTGPVTGTPGCWWPDPTSGAAPPGSTLPGVCRTGVLKRLSPPLWQTSSAPTAPRSGCSPSAFPPRR